MAEVEEVQNKKMTVLRDEKMLELEDDSGFWTVKCLRGRLLAERAASKAAKDNVELLEKKLIELEEKLQQEIKLKNKAEKRLKYLIKKLESLNLSSPGASSLSSSSVKSEQQCYSSSSTASSTISEDENPVTPPLEHFAMCNRDTRETDITPNRPTELKNVGDTNTNVSRYNTSLNRECVKHFGAVEQLRNQVKQQCC